MHYSVLHPEDYGIKSYTVKLPSFEENEYTTYNIVLENYISTLKKIKPGKLDSEQSLTYQILLDGFEYDLSTNQFPYYDEPLSPGSGMQSQLPILLAEYSFTCEKDIEDYLSLLDSIKYYFETIEGYETAKSEKGLFMADYSADKIMNQCDVIMDSSLIENGEHFLITTFNERIDKAFKQNLIDGDDVLLYQSENKRLLETVVAPAYRKLADTILLLKGSGDNGKGLCYYENGADYYSSLVKKTTGSDKNITQIKTLLYKKLQKDNASFSTLAASLNKLEYDGSFDTFPLSKPEEMLADLEQRITADYPAYPNQSQTSYTVKYVDESLADFVSPAFYLTPPIDNLKENSIYINQQSIPDPLELYTTLAHEGYPGHLYQSVYYQLNQNDSDSIPIRNLLYFGGYTEGWALYVENNSYEYAKDIIDEKVGDAGQREFLKIYYDLYRLDRDMRICLYSLLDIAIHHDGISYEEAAAALAQFGMKDAAVTRSIYEYIVEEPANYLKYYLGYLEILECRDTAKDLWKSDYSDKAFHQFFLEAGPMSFPMLQDLLEKTVTDKTYISFKN